MPPITWRNVNAPSDAGALALLNRSGQQLGSAISGVGESLQQGTDAYVDQQTNEFIAELNAAPDDASRNQMLEQASKAFLDVGRADEAITAAGREDRAVTAEARAALAGEDAHLAAVAKRDLAQQEQDTLQSLLSPGGPTPQTARATTDSTSPLEVAAAGYQAPTDDARRVSDLKERVIGAESSGDPNARNPEAGSTSSGLFGVTDPTMRTPQYGVKGIQEGETPAAAKERIGGELIDAMDKEYKGNIPRMAAGYHFGKGVADNWNGDRDTLGAAVREHGNLTSAQVTDRLEGWDSYVQKWQGDESATMSKKTALAQIRPQPQVNPAIFGAIQKFSSSSANAAVKNARDQAIADQAKWALMGRVGVSPGTLKGLTPDEVNTEYKDALGYMPENLDPDESAKALKNALRKAGANVSTIGKGGLSTDQKLRKEKIVHVDKLYKDANKLKSDNTFNSVVQHFNKGKLKLGASELESMRDTLREQVVFPNFGAEGDLAVSESDKDWLIHAAMIKGGGIDEQIIGTDFTYAGEDDLLFTTDSEIVAKLQISINELVRQHSRPAGRAVINGESVNLPGSILSLPQRKKR